MLVAFWNRGSNAAWFESWQRARTADDFPKRSIRMRSAGVLVATICAGFLTAVTELEIETWSSSFGSRRRKMRVSTARLSATLNEYCTLEKADFSGNSLRILTQLEETGTGPSDTLVRGPAITASSVTVDLPCAIS